MQKFLECLNDWALAKVGRIKSGSQPVFSRFVRVVNVKARCIHPLALVGFKPGDDDVMLWVDIGRLPTARQNGNKKKVERTEPFPAMQTLQQAVRGFVFWPSGAVLDSAPTSGARELGR